MMDLGPHAAFIWASYAAVTITLAGLIFWLIGARRRTQKQLEQLEARGISRRSSLST